MKRINSFLLIPLTLVITFFAGCSKMDDKIDEFLKDGERIYIGKLDSLIQHVGDKRVKLSFWASDPRAKSVTFYWYPNNDSLTIPINPSNNNTYFEIFVGGTNSPKIIAEGNYTFRAITRDASNHSSIPYEKIINIYGEAFRSTLTNRVLKTVSYAAATSNLSLSFSGPVNDNEIGIEISYTDKAGVEIKLPLSNAAITTPLLIQSVDKTKTVSYKTRFIPEPLAIDTFYTESKNINIP